MRQKTVRETIKANGGKLVNDNEQYTIYYQNGMVRMGGFALDYNGVPVEKTKDNFPYSYDMHVIHRDGDNSEVNNTIYSDRLLQWDYKKHNQLCLKHFGNEGQYWDGRYPKKIEAFLRDWCNDQELKLIVVMEGCNPSNGYPYWSFWFKHSTTYLDTNKTI